MSQQRKALWDVDEDLQDVDLSLAIGNYGQNGIYDEGERSPACKYSKRHANARRAAEPRIDEATLLAVQQQMVQQAAFAQIPDVVKRVSDQCDLPRTNFDRTDRAVHRTLPPCCP